MPSSRLTVGHEFPPVELPPVTRVQLARFAGATGDFNPIHVDEEFAKAAGMPSAIGSGPMSMSFLASALTQWVPLHAVRQLSGRFKSINPPGTVVTCRGRVTAVGEDGTVECELIAESDAGVVITEVTALLSLA